MTAKKPVCGNCNRKLSLSSFKRGEVVTDMEQYNSDGEIESSYVHVVPCVGKKLKAIREESALLMATKATSLSAV